MSVGEWLNSVIERDDDDADGRPRRRRHRESMPFGAPRRDGRDDGGPYRDGYRDDRYERRPDPDEEVYRERHARRDRTRERADPRRRDEFDQVHNRLDTLSQQLERLARAQVERPEPPSSWNAPAEPSLSIDDAVAEIAARRRALDGDATSADGAAAAPSASRPALDFRGLEKQLHKITTRIDALQPSGDVGNAIAALRTDLADIGRQLHDALPRRAVESLEIEIKALADRIDHSRQAGVDPNALTGLERGLAEIREALRGLTPAESLAGFDEAVNALAQKVDMILARDDPAALQQLEAAIGGLRGVVSHVASNDTLTRVAEEVRALAAQVDGIANNAATGHAVSALEQRIDTLAAALHASSEAGQAVPRDLEKLLAGLIEKLEWVQLTHTDHAALAHLEDRIAMLVKRFDASEARLGQMEAIERGLADLLVHIEQMRGIDGDAARAARLAPAPARALEADVTEIKHSERRTQDSLEAVQDTVAHVVDRLATIESNLHEGAQPPAAAAETQTFFESPIPLAPQPEPPPDIEPAAVEAPPAPLQAVAIAPAAPQPRSAARPPIDPTLPPDHPLEPGSAGARSRPNASAAERVAASQAAIGSAKPPVIADSGRPNFIAAARRAAQAAAWEPSAAKAKDEPGTDKDAEPSKLSQRLRKLIMAGSALLIVIGCLRIGIRLFNDNHMNGSSPPAQSEQVVAPAAPTPTPLAQQASPAQGPAAPAPPLPLPNPNGAAAPRPDAGPAKTAKPSHQSLLQDGERETVADGARPVGGLPTWATPDMTGTVPRSVVAPDLPRSPAPAAAAAVIEDKLPASIGDPALRAAALGGDPAAAYEVAARFAEGRGVPQNHVEAALWLERAAKQGLAPAQFRLGGLYEKGIGVKKDLIRARDLYLAAAEKGNGKAMHNLAVLYAEGVNGAPDYNSAAEWFRKAADRGLRDSQYNLGILYARGIGVSQNYAEAYKWFALAASQGDQDAATKGDDIAARLDAQSLAAARLAVKNFTPEPQPDDAINVRAAAAWQSTAKLQHPAKPK